MPFYIQPEDSVWKARFKMLYLTPIGILRYPLNIIEAGYEAVGPLFQKGNFAEAWNHNKTYSQSWKVIPQDTLTTRRLKAIYLIPFTLAGVVCLVLPTVLAVCALEAAKEAAAEFKYNWWPEVKSIFKSMWAAIKAE